jgi:hypothetical protein
MLKRLANVRIRETMTTDGKKRWRLKTLEHFGCDAEKLALVPYGEHPVTVELNTALERQ